MVRWVFGRFVGVAAVDVEKNLPTGWVLPAG